MRCVLGAIAAGLMGGAAVAEPAPVSFAKMVVRIPSGTPWAQLQQDDFPFPCVSTETLTWKSADSDVAQDPEFERTFRNELGAAGFPVSGDPSNLFEEDHKASDLQVGALVTGIQARFCATQSLKDALFESNRITIKGSVQMKVEWQVYSTSEARILARIRTEGEHVLAKGVDGGNHVLLQQAFGENVRRLVASDAFRAAVNTPQAAAAPASSAAPLTVAYRPAGGPVSLDQAAAGVVSIFAGQGMGSGVLISSDGYVLTNHHVAGDARRVRVRWPDGTDTPGEVVRTDRGRDVALIKTAPRGTPVGIRSAPARLGETVYAIGTPRERDFAGSVTRGVVSAPNRTLEGRSYIQSDVAVTNGNSGGALIDDTGGLIGLSVAGYAPGGVPQNINFFIPIGDALRALALVPVN